MRVVASVEEARSARAALEGSVGFVPTMGCLHDGHLALVRRARAETNRVVASIFVNPIQFGPAEDLASYPRTRERDLDFLEQEGVSLVFVPTEAVIYPEGYDTYVEVGALTRRLEGAARPGHFRGVATVVAKLLNIVSPDRMYMGEKDAQQLRVVRKMVSDLAFPVEVVAIPTVREADGLAMSSRNRYLSPDERRAAAVIPGALAAARESVDHGERRADQVRDLVAAAIAAESLAAAEYISVADPDTLDEVDVIAGPALLSVAVRVGKTRLIDNTTLLP